MRVAVVEKDRCQPKRCHYECVTFCPVVRQGVTDCIKPGPDQGKAVISEELCVGCGICVHKCPFDAIHIINLPEALDTDLTHQYGVNGFRLFRLPVPQKGRILGLLGRNGIGKTTAIRILSGEEVPNLGNVEKPGSWLEVVARYGATELGNYLKEVAGGRVKTAVKPQYVDRIPRVVSGTVEPLLRKTDERGLFDETVDALGLRGVLDHDLKKLSGGELQRVAIAATYMKKADVYLFDEPSSYLDIFQRIRVARLIRDMAEDHAVVVIEHDLAVLDFLADEVQLFYGTEAAYGVVALPRPVRTGINVYLSGYMKEENVRFRDAKIEFEVHPPREKWETDVLLAFPAAKKSFGDAFSLETGAGEIHVGEVVGVVGPNATGKTTFVKMLAGEFAPDDGALASNASFSYKPQYIRTDFTDRVVDLLYTKLGSSYDDPFFQNEIARPLDMERLAEKNVDRLSGGELQRVFVALALAPEKDLYLLDEPSAYLDTDQRLMVAKTIRRVMEKRGKSALVVDHDVYFLDLMADSLMVFGGEPGRRGVSEGPFDMRTGMNRFLSDVGITFRRDRETKRPRVNKAGSRLDREQKARGEYYYEALAGDEE